MSASSASDGIGAIVVTDWLYEPAGHSVPIVQKKLPPTMAPARLRNTGEDYISWERPEPMELWQLDIVGSVVMADGTEAKVITGVDDNSRFSSSPRWCGARRAAPCAPRL